MKKKASCTWYLEFATYFFKGTRCNFWPSSACIFKLYAFCKRTFFFGCTSALHDEYDEYGYPTAHKTFTSRLKKYITGLDGMDLKLTS